MMPKSLANRMTLVVVGALVLAFGTAGVALYGRVKRSLELKAEKALEVRLTWLASSIDLDQRVLSMESRVEPNDGAEGWRVATAAGRELWHDEHAFPGDGQEALVKQRHLVLSGQTASITRNRDRETVLLLWRAVGEGQGAEKSNGTYLLGEGEDSVDLVLSAAYSSRAMHAELLRLRWALWTVGPVSVLLISLLCAWLIRWQLRPLAEIAQRAAGIGPEQSYARLEPVAGESVECAQLRAAIDSMVVRLAEGLEREKQFVGDASHELRTPLAQLRTQIEVALRKKDRPAEAYVQTLQEALLDILRLQELTAGFLELARSDGRNANGAAVLSVTVQEVLRQALVKSELPVSLPAASASLQVAGHAHLLYSAFENVLSNACKYAPGAPPRVLLEEDAERVSIAVLDAGPGVPEADRERIFQPLVRLDEARREGGFGLGLAIARKAVRACGGELVCRARRDGQSGAEFVFHLRKALALPA